VKFSSYKGEKLECPCKICLVRSMCRRRVVRKGIESIEYLIVEYLEKCPYILEYFGIHPKTHIIFHCHKKINELCELFGTYEGESHNFVWIASNIGVYP
jgi:hypothetical protein